MIGLTLYSVSMAFLVNAGLGMIPWDVFHFGVAKHITFTLGQVVIATSIIVLLLWIPLKETPGVGTIANAFWIGVVLDPVIYFLPKPDVLLWQIVMMLLGVVLNGVATAMYIGAHFGPGPRDGLMTGLSRRTGQSIRRVRTVLEVSVVAIGWLLGGVLGVGTVIYALAIGPLTQKFLPYFDTRR